MVEVESDGSTRLSRCKLRSQGDDLPSFLLQEGDRSVKCIELKSLKLKNSKIEYWNRLENGGTEDQKKNLVHSPNCYCIEELIMAEVITEYVEEIPVKKETTAIVLGGEEFSLVRMPPSGSVLVEYGKKEILQNLSLYRLVSGLENAAGLINAAYNALGGTVVVQGSVATLQANLLALSSESIVTVQGFKSNSETIVSNLISAYKQLFKGREERALINLESCGKCAENMSKAASELSDKFKALQKETSEASSASLNERNLQKKEREKLEEQQEEIKNAKKGLEEVQQKREEAVKEANNLYKEAADREKTESTRAFALQLVGTFGQIAIAGLGAYASTKGLSAGGTAGKVIAGTHVATSLMPLLVNNKDEKKGIVDSPELKNVREQIDASAKELENKKKKINDLDEQIRQKDNDLNAEVNKNEKADSQKINELESDLKKLKDERQKLETENTGLNNRLSELSAAFSNLAATGASLQERLASKTQNALDHKMAVEKEYRDNLEKLGQLAAKLKSLPQYIATTAAAVETLQKAVECLNIVIVTLDEAAFFWSQMAEFCKRLSESNLGQHIEVISRTSSQEERINQYLEPEFMFPSALLLSRWVALNQICLEYLDALNKVRKQIQENVKDTPTPEQAVRKAPELAAAVLKKIEHDKILVNQSINQCEEDKLEAVKILVSQA